MENKLDNLVNHLFMQLERFGDDEFCNDPKAFEREIKKAHAIADVSHNIIEINKLQLEAVNLALKYNVDGKELPENWNIKIKKIDMPPLENRK